jgi:hypothetical protein
MAVVVDRAFFDSVGEMDKVADISNADIARFIVKSEEVPGSKYSLSCLSALVSASAVKRKIQQRLRADYGDGELRGVGAV